MYFQRAQVKIQAEMAECLKKTRKSYTREQKLDVIRWHTVNGENLDRTCKHFSLNSKTVLHWINDHTAGYIATTVKREESV